MTDLGLSVSPTSQSWCSVWAVSLQSGRPIRIQVTLRTLVLLPPGPEPIYLPLMIPNPLPSVRLSSRDPRLALRPCC